MDQFLEVAEKLVVYQLRSAWLQIAKLYNEMADEEEITIGMAFVLLAINRSEGLPVTQIAPRLGMEPNSLSRVLKNMESKKIISRKKDARDKRIVHVSLTKQGNEVRQKALRAVFDLEKSITRHIDETKLDAFFEVVGQLPYAIEIFKQKNLNKDIK